MRSYKQHRCNYPIISIHSHSLCLSFSEISKLQINVSHKWLPPPPAVALVLGVWARWQGCLGESHRRSTSEQEQLQVTLESGEACGRRKERGFGYWGNTSVAQTYGGVWYWDVDGKELLGITVGKTSTGMKGDRNKRKTYSTGQLYEIRSHNVERCGNKPSSASKSAHI